MTTVPLGAGAYKRLAAHVPEIRLENRFIEVNPANLREHTMLHSRPGTSDLATFATDTPAALKGPRGHYAKTGLFGGDLFVVSGANFYRFNAAGVTTPITGVVNGTGHPNVAWMKGIGYEYLFITDGLLLQFYTGGSHATGVLTLAGGAITSQILQIGPVYYTWGAAVNAGPPDGSLAHPWIAKLGATNADSLAAMANLLNFNGVRGTDFSTALGGPSTQVTAAAGATTLTLTSISAFADGNAIATAVASGSFLTWGGATLSGGNVHALQGVPMPGGVATKALAAVSGSVLVSVANSQQVFFIQPGATTVDPLDFFSKESNPDNVVDMLTVGDQVLITGNGSTENWYATGDLAAPFAPVEGRVYQRGVIDGTPCGVQDGAMFVGDDGVAYEVGYGGQAGFGVNRISDHGIEERIRKQLRREQGLS